MYEQSLGIDVAAKELQVCFKVRRADGTIKIKGSRKFMNSSKGFDALEKWIAKKRLADPKLLIPIVMEATGVYYESLAYHFYEKGYQVHVLLPNRIKAFLKFLNLKSKTDQLEAKALAELGISQRLESWQPASPLIYGLKQLHRERNRLIDFKTMVSNQLHAHQSKRAPEKNTLNRLKTQQTLIDEQIKQVETELVERGKQDPKLWERIENICTIKGVGTVTALALIAETNGFALIERKAQLVSYAGYDVIERQSGSSVKGKSRISKKGNRHIRRAMHFPALSVVKYNQKFKNLFNRVFERTKIKMKAYVAVQRKLLVLIYTLFKNNCPYDPNFTMKTVHENSRQPT